MIVLCAFGSTTVSKGRFALGLGFSGEFFTHLAESSQFHRVAVVNGAVTWPGNLDLAPDAMHRQLRSGANGWLKTEEQEEVSGDDRRNQWSRWPEMCGRDQPKPPITIAEVRRRCRRDAVTPSEHETRLICR